MFLDGDDSDLYLTLFICSGEVHLDQIDENEDIIYKWVFKFQ